jgi:hydroxymethylbilane synthase
VNGLRIGTRSSALALAQAEEVRALLGREGLEAEIVPITTTGDEGTPAGSAPLGAGATLKGLWIDAIVEALRNGEIDVAVHSAKDLPAEDEEDLTIGAVPERADPRDVLILAPEREPGPGVRIGTSSLRRRAQLLAAYPGVQVVELRGNVPTRLRKVTDGEVDGAVLAAAGLARLSLVPVDARELGVDVMVPAPGQGCLAVQCRTEDRSTQAALTMLEHRPSRIALETERALVRLLEGGCALPLGAIAAAKRDTVRLAGLVASSDGSQVVTAAAEAHAPERAAGLVADQLLELGAGSILDGARGA